MTPFMVMIPARYGASRLPGKPLLPLAGRPVIEHVWQSAINSGAERVVIATDHDKIAEVARGFGAEVCLTADNHPSGTSRLAEVAATLEIPDQTVIVNLQGDEPMMPPALLAQVADVLESCANAAVGTLATPIRDSDELHDPHAVKVVTTHEGAALYFSRAPIPWDRSGHGSAQVNAALRHLGIYAYRARFLRGFPNLPASPLEALEQLEQLRFLQTGKRIQVGIAQTRPGHGIDTRDDLLAAEALLADAGEQA